jgi:hypothetical protein
VTQELDWPSYLDAELVAQDMFVACSRLFSLRCKADVELRACLSQSADISPDFVLCSSTLTPFNRLMRSEILPWFK